MNIIETATTTELAIVERLVARLKQSVETSVPAVDVEGKRIYGVVLEGEERTDLATAIAAEAGAAILVLDGDLLASRQMPLPKFNDVTWAFGPSRWKGQSTSSHVVVYIRNFGILGSSRRASGGNADIDTVVAQFLVELGKLEKIGAIFVLVSSDQELDCALTREGRLQRLQDLRL